MQLKNPLKPLTREQKGLLRDNETSIRENKPDLSKSAKDKDSGISSERNQQAKKIGKDPKPSY